MSATLTPKQIVTLATFQSESIRVSSGFEGERLLVEVNYAMGSHLEYERYITPEGVIERWDDDKYNFVPATIAPIQSLDYVGATGIHFLRNH